MSTLRKSKRTDGPPVGEYRHTRQSRKNNPAAGLARNGSGHGSVKYSAEIDPHDSPILLFNGREESDSIEADIVNLHKHESVHPAVILDPVTRKKSVLDDFFGDTRPHNEAVEFYQHEDGWANRLVAGDSLLVMNSLLEKENMAGKVQMIYFDPPYGIKYSSNFQPYVFDTRVKDSTKNVEMRPEPIKAFRDTWENGIHSYLAMVRKRLTLAKELLADTGSIFVQISTENQHRIRVLLDEVFGPENFMWQIMFKTKGGGVSGARPNTHDYVIWYAKNKESAKFNRLWKDRTDESIKRLYKQIRLKDGTIETAPKEGRLPKGARRCMTLPLHSQSASTTDRSEPHTFPNGKTYSPPSGRQWSVSRDVLDALYNMGRLYFSAGSVRSVSYPEDSPELFDDTWKGERNSKIYAVETHPNVIQNCMLMCSDVGDLVMDITTGSGVTAYVAEQWGRRWITCDTSRVSLATVRWRLQTATYDWYKLVNDAEGVDSGFRYEESVRMTKKILAEGEIETVTRYDKPKIERNRGRVTGPFTVESIPAPVVINGSETVHMPTTRGDLLRRLEDSGIKTKTTRLRFDRIEKNSDDTSPVHAHGYVNGDRIAISFGPEHGPMGRHQVDSVLAAGGRALFLAMAFDPVAKSIIDKTDGALSALINNDVLISDLKSKSTDQPFSMVGEPEISITGGKKDRVVEILGYDYYDPSKDKVTTGDTSNIAMWMLDTDYDGRTLRVKQFFFPKRPDLWESLESTLRSEVDPDMLERYSGTKSIPFETGSNRQIAVKIIDNEGNESLTVRGLEGW